MTSVAELTAAEQQRFAELHPRCGELWRAGEVYMPDGVPMLWMAKWPGPWPLHVEDASGAHFRCADDIDFVDLCLGDTGAMCGHAPPATVAAISAQLLKGSTFMLPTASARDAAALLEQRFGLPLWQFTLSATDANRSLIRYARQVTGRPRILVIDKCYHGTVDEAYAELENGEVVSRRGNIGAPVPLGQTTAVVPFNDLAAMERALRRLDVAAVLIEPAMTNIGIVLPDDGWHEAVRDLCTETATLLIIDETHTLSAGPGGMTLRDGLEPDAVVVGKTIAGGIPAGAYGMTADLAERVRSSLELEDIDVGGVGGTLAGNAVSMAGIVATIGEVLTAEAYPAMIDRATEWTTGVQQAIDEFGLPWQVTQLGARSEYSFRANPPANGAEAADADDFELQQFLHLHALNRGILMTPFHNMALMCPVTTSADVERHTAAFRDALEALTA